MALKGKKLISISYFALMILVEYPEAKHCPITVNKIKQQKSRHYGILFYVYCVTADCGTQ